MGNRLSGEIPDWLGNLTNLTTLSISVNNLDGPIPDLGALTSLMVLDLSGQPVERADSRPERPHQPGGAGPQRQQLGREIPDLSALINLTVLNLSGNQVIGTIPNLSRLTRLTQLALNNNSCAGRSRPH